MIVQLCMIVGLGIKLKFKWGPGGRHYFACLNPRIAASVLLKRANLSFVLMCVMTDAYAYGFLHFSAIFSASLLLTLMHSDAMPPLVVKTRGW